LAGPEGSPTELIDVDTDESSEQLHPVAGPEENGARDDLEEPLPSDGLEGTERDRVFEAGGATYGSEEGDATPEPALPPEADSPMATCTVPAGLICEPVSGTGCLPHAMCRRSQRQRGGGLLLVQQCSARHGLYARSIGDALPAPTHMHRGRVP
jgi:hypothetical protein